MEPVWQIASGELGRYYDDLFVEYDVMFMGPGNGGSFTEERYKEVIARKRITPNKKNQIRSFVNGPKQGHKVLLRRGHKVVSIGVVADDNYEWKQELDDVYGWDLQHTRRVIWQSDIKGIREELQCIQDKKPLFGDRKQVPTFTGVSDQKILQPLQGLLAKTQLRDLKPFNPSVSEPLSIELLGEELFDRGLANDSVNEVIAAIQRQRRLSKWYSSNAAKMNRPTEHEVVAHMILPLMLALGWSEQLLAVEWHKVDLAGFRETPTDGDTCNLICEAKALWHGHQNAYQQALKYESKLKLGGCRKIMVTTGLHIYLYEKQKGMWPDVPQGYINIQKLRTKHFAPRNTNAIETLIALTPAGVERSMNSTS